ncbi:nicotinate-nucleotide adenylyltransferase [Niallia taxi]|uniref:Probable nicotinate-nucleotide adenylyltransferase n=1 Tax=Niallia taxi TaxID=2499688 RepID=A0A437KDQ4_9BACI|nr:nicotinate-nucleotide adenylyltransferase [Niallia taxi]MCM3215302.1 nicotinate-nucleotide adenylyltransferase [Niallia taxi]MDK8639603.1 nicotinate-nucleotide adenylyltransferase [Niallia taxi]MED4037977.1 nicotinate-nucleotide adenylyltransferase [Niallia taxi]RVT65162.1 nicotinate-nucleotide adenylyltransferase [Niallia taxi]
MRKKIGILGGTFDPPHIGHLIIANEVMHHENLDEIWFMPNQEPPHKIKSGSASNEDRLAMLRLAIKDKEGFHVQTIELDREGKSYTFDTMTILKEMHPEFEFHFIIGADMVEYLPKWYMIDELLQLVHFISVNRPNYSIDTSYPVQFVEVPDINISSKLIRGKLIKGETISFLVKEEVERYIKEKRLYES